MSPDFFLDCCSRALDIVVLGAGMTAVVDPYPTETVGGHVATQVIRLMSPFINLKIPGLSKKGVDKKTNPFRIYVVPSNDTKGKAKKAAKKAAAKKTAAKKATKKK